MVTVTCAGCSKQFDAPTVRRKWCEPACKVRTARAAKAAAGSDPETDGVAAGKPTKGLKPEDPLVAAVRKELEEADAVTTVDGQIALHLASQVKAATGSSASSLAKELRTVLDRVKPPTPTPSSGTGAADDDDPAETARKAREAKAAAMTAVTDG